MKVNFRNPYIYFGSQNQTNKQIPDERKLGNNYVIPEWPVPGKPGSFFKELLDDEARSLIFARMRNALENPNSLSIDAPFLADYFVGTDDDIIRWTSAAGLKNLTDANASYAEKCFEYIKPKLVKMVQGLIAGASSPLVFSEEELSKKHFISFLENYFLGKGKSLLTGSEAIKLEEILRRLS